MILLYTCVEFDCIVIYNKNCVCDSAGSCFFILKVLQRHVLEGTSLSGFFGGYSSKLFGLYALTLVQFHCSVEQVVILGMYIFAKREVGKNWVLEDLLPVVCTLNVVTRSTLKRPDSNPQSHLKRFLCPNICTSMCTDKRYLCAMGRKMYWKQGKVKSGAVFALMNSSWYIIFHSPLGFRHNLRHRQHGHLRQTAALRDPILLHIKYSTWFGFKRQHYKRSGIDIHGRAIIVSWSWEHWWVEY